MKISFNIEVNLLKEERDLLTHILGCEEYQLNDKLGKIANSSFEEYKSMILGQKVFTRGRDILEYRLFILIKYFFNGIIPEEQKVCELFQVTANESQSLIKSIMSKYQYELRETIKKTLHEVVRNIFKDPNSSDYKSPIQNQFFKDELNRLLGIIDPSLPIISKDKGTISTYIIKPSSYEKLCEYFKIEKG